MLSQTKQQLYSDMDARGKYVEPTMPQSFFYDVNTRKKKAIPRSVLIPIDKKLAN